MERKTYSTDLTDDQWALMEPFLHGAHIQDRDGAKFVLTGCKERFPRLKLIWADGGYAGKLLAWVKEQGDWEVEIVKRCDDLKGFVLLPRRLDGRTYVCLDRALSSVV